jgi:hypothetical protein
MHHNKNINCKVEIDTPGHIPSTAGDSGIRSWGCRVPLYTLALKEGKWVKYLATYSQANIPLETHPLVDFMNHF